jgi:peptidoglycan L-alanyl-D-glutamate endopeptidase CwlK
MSFRLGSKSRANLEGVHPSLVRVVEVAITQTRQDFRVHDGVRSIAEQRVLLARGVSWTMKSKHLRQADGFGHAVDLVPLVDGKLAWDWQGCLSIAAAVALAAEQLQVRVRWGGVWDKELRTYASSPAAVEAESAAYVRRRRSQGKRAAIDGPHFES